ncbi:MAG: HAD family hydrolase [Thermoguttaceae bacterium]|jgi:FMN phosphatase YigB (HAD superfamily)
MNQVTVVITDLDNTLFDWVKIWYEPFNAMLGEIHRISGISQDILIQDIKQVFTRRETSEYAFVIQEIESLKKKYPREDLTKKFDSAIHAFRVARKRALYLYPEVEDTLQLLKDKGVLIVGYTESQAFYTHFRMKALGLDRILDFVYSPTDHDLPEGLTPEQLRTLSPEHYKLRRTIHRYTPKGKLKPNPNVLLQIIKEIGATPDEVVYVGDSQMKDICMAQEANVTDVWAKYGTPVETPAYELLRQVTHWSNKSVEKEKEIIANPFIPSHTLERSFSEILSIFQFKPFIDRSVERINYCLEAWKVTVDVQKHFNDLEMRIRNFALTLITAAIAAAGFMFKEDIRLPIFGINFPLGSVVIIGAIPIWFAFFLMDRYWYHKFLLGAVRHGHYIERRFHMIIPEIGLSEAISKASPSRICGITIHSHWKINIFYMMGIVVLIIASVLAFFTTKASKTNSQETTTTTNLSSSALIHNAHCPISISLDNNFLETFVIKPRIGG